MQAQSQDFGEGGWGIGQLKPITQLQTPILL